MKINNKLFFSRILILVIGGFFFYIFQDWLILPIFAIIWFLFEYKKLKFSKRKNMLKISLIIGVFLMIFDFVIENLGYTYGFWVSKQSYLFVLYVPIEVMLTCFFGGAAWTLFAYPRFGDRKFVIFNPILWTMGGTVGEWFLNSINFMTYGNGWLSLPHAFLAYLFTFFILHYIIIQGS